MVCILSTVKKAARLAVNVASMRTTNNQYAATRTLPDIDLGASPPPTKQGNWITVLLSMKWRNNYYILLVIPWGVNEVSANQKLSFSVNSLKKELSKWDSLGNFVFKYIRRQYKWDQIPAWIGMGGLVVSSWIRRIFVQEPQHKSSQNKCCKNSHPCLYPQNLC